LFGDASPIDHSVLSFKLAKPRMATSFLSFLINSGFKNSIPYL